jgi:hypothetical protein
MGGVLYPNCRLRRQCQTLAGLPVRKRTQDGEADQNPSPNNRLRRQEGMDLPPAGGNGMRLALPEEGGRGEVRCGEASPAAAAAAGGEERRGFLVGGRRQRFQFLFGVEGGGPFLSATLSIRANGPILNWAATNTCCCCWASLSLFTIVGLVLITGP